MSIAFGSLVLFPRYGSSPVCFIHNNSGEKCPCIKLLNFLIQNDEITLRNLGNGKRNFASMSNSAFIEANDSISEIESSKLFLNISTKPRPLTFNDVGHKTINVLSYQRHIDMSIPLVFLAVKGCTCSFIDSSTGIWQYLFIYTYIYVCIYR